MSVPQFFWGFGAGFFCNKSNRSCKFVTMRNETLLFGWVSWFSNLQHSFQGTTIPRCHSHLQTSPISTNLSNPRCLEQMSTKVSLLNTKLNHMKRPPGNALGRWGTTLDTAKRQQVELIVNPTSDAVFWKKITVNHSFWQNMYIQMI